MTLIELAIKLKEFDTIPEKLNHLQKYDNMVCGVIVNFSTNHRYMGYFTVHILAKKLKRMHFPELDKNVSFSNWFLEYNADRYFKSILLTDEYLRKLNSNRRQKFIERKLQILENEKREADRREAIPKKGGIDSSTRYRDSKGYLYLLNDDDNYYYIEILRILEGNYYTGHTTEHSYNTLGSPEVRAYAKHILLKNHLIELLGSNSTLKKDNKSKAINNLVDLFLDPANAAKCISVLREVEPPVIDIANCYLLGLRQKGSVTAWVMALKSKGLIKNVTDDKLSKLLNKEFTDLDLSKDGRTLRNPQTTAYNKYYTKILNLLP